MKLEAWAVGITAGSRELPGRKGLWQETIIIIIIIISCIREELAFPGRERHCDYFSFFLYVILFSHFPLDKKVNLQNTAHGFDISLIETKMLPCTLEVTFSVSGRRHWLLTKAHYSLPSISAVLCCYHVFVWLPWTRTGWHKFPVTQALPCLNLVQVRNDAVVSCALALSHCRRYFRNHFENLHFLNKIWDPVLILSQFI